MSAADEKLHDAIAERMREESEGDPRVGPLTHYIVVGVTLNPSDEHEDAVWLLFSGGTMPTWQSLGLLAAGTNALLTMVPESPDD